MLREFCLLVAISQTAAVSCIHDSQPCPVPKGWTEKATWNLTESSIIQPGSAHSADFFNVTHPWGLVSLDWSVAWNIWNKDKNPKTGTGEATSVEGCRRLKAQGVKKCFIYHNMELALEWMESQRAVMYDPAKADWFLQFTDGKGHKNGTILNDPTDQPLTWFDQYLWDFRNPEALRYFVDSIAQSLSDEAVDGTYTDDVVGFPREHETVVPLLNLTTTEVEDLLYWTEVASATLVGTLAEQGKGNWQAMTSVDYGIGDAVSPGPNKTSCMAFMREHCQPGYQDRMMTMEMPRQDRLSDTNQTVASFIVTRPPVAYLGWGWESGDDKWNDIFLLQVGEPIPGVEGLCQEKEQGVFTREYTLGTATLNCNTWTADMPFDSL